MGSWQTRNKRMKRSTIIDHLRHHMEVCDTNGVRDVDEKHRIMWQGKASAYRAAIQLLEMGAK